MLQGCRRRVGDGKVTRVWKVPWLPDVHNGYLTTEIYPQLEDITVNNLMSTEEGVWDRDIIDELCNDRDRELIYQVPIPIRRRSDSWLWLFEADGVFSVRSCYRRLRGEGEGQEREFRK